MKKIIIILSIFISIILISTVGYFTFDKFYYKPIDYNTLLILQKGNAQEVLSATKKIKLNKSFIVYVSNTDLSDDGIKYETSILAYVAAFNPNPEVIETLIKNGANPDKVLYDRLDNADLAILNSIIYNPNPEVTKILLKYTNIDKLNNKKIFGKKLYANMFHSANFNKNPQILDVLLKDETFKNKLSDSDIGIGVELFATNKHGASPEQLLKVMVDNGIDINKKYSTKRYLSPIEIMQLEYNSAKEINNKESMKFYQNAINTIKKYSK